MENIIERTTETENAIANRLRGFDFPEEKIQKYALYDWSNWTEHYNWIMTETPAKINGWMVTLERDARSEEEIADSKREDEYLADMDYFDACGED